MKPMDITTAPPRSPSFSNGIFPSCFSTTKEIADSGISQPTSRCMEEIPECDYFVATLRVDEIYRSRMTAEERMMAKGEVRL